jgi:hypothetical protein
LIHEVITEAKNRRDHCSSFVVFVPFALNTITR